MINKTIKTIFTEPKVQEVLCSLYDSELKPAEISSLLSIDLKIVNKHLSQLCKTGLVTKKTKESEEFYCLTNTKICDAILMLKDELYKDIRKMDYDVDK